MKIWRLRPFQHLINMFRRSHVYRFFFFIFHSSLSEIYVNFKSRSHYWLWHFGACPNRFQFSTREQKVWKFQFSKPVDCRGMKRKTNLQKTRCRRVKSFSEIISSGAEWRKYKQRLKQKSRLERVREKQEIHFEFDFEQNT